MAVQAATDESMTHPTVPLSPLTAAAAWAWRLIVLLSLVIGAYAIFHVATRYAFVPPEVTANRFPTEFGLHLHIAAAGIALLAGPLQFVRTLRVRRPRLHRLAGRTYVAAVLVGGGAGAAIALSTAHGPVAGSGFLIMGVLWLATTLAGLRAVLRRDFRAHEEWMVRSFALAFAAVTQRLYLLFILAPGLNFEIVYPAAAWLCWVPNLILAETWLRLRRRHPALEAEQRSAFQTKVGIQQSP